MPFPSEGKLLRYNYAHPLSLQISQQIPQYYNTFSTTGKGLCVAVESGLEKLLIIGFPGAETQNPVLLRFCTFILQYNHSRHIRVLQAVLFNLVG